MTSRMKTHPEAQGLSHFQLNHMLITALNALAASADHYRNVQQQPSEDPAGPSRYMYGQGLDDTVPIAQPYTRTTFSWGAVPQNLEADLLQVDGATTTADNDYCPHHIGPSVSNDIWDVFDGLSNRGF